MLLLSERYGWVQPSGKSATHEEYEEANEMHRPVLAVIRSDMTPEPLQAALIDEVRDWAGGEAHGSFTGPVDLRAAVVRALHEHVLAEAAGPIDTADLHGRAAAALPMRRGFMSGAPTFAVAVAGGPDRVVIRPGELQNPVFGRWLQQEAMFGDNSILDAADATRTVLNGGQILLEQSSASVLVNERGTVAISQPARTRSDGLGSIAVIQEDVHDRISRAPGFADQVLERVDALHRLTDLVCLVALVGAGYGAWRARAEQQASPDSVEMNMQGAYHGLVETQPTQIGRRALRSQRLRLADDLTIRLRRAATEGR